MPRLLISYDLLEPSHTKGNREALYAALHALGAVQIQDSLWVVRTEMNVPTMRAELQGHFFPHDRLLVALISDSMSKAGINELPRG